MTDAQFLFQQDAKQKKSIARQAQYRKRGSKSKKCSLPSDGMTAKQWREACGPVETYKMNEPVSWEVFKSYPNDIKKLYINGLVEKYSVTSPQLAEMFGISAVGVRNYFKQNNIAFASRGKAARMTAEQKERWRVFLNGFVNIGDADREGASTEMTTDQAVPVVNDADTMAMVNLTLDFVGEININTIANALQQLLREHSRGAVHIDIALNV